MSKTSPHHPNPVLYGCLRAIVRFLFWILARVEITGSENIPTQGAYIVAINHLSAIDPPLILAVFPRPLTVFAADTHRHEIIAGAVMNCLGAIWVKRGEVDRHALHAALDLLQEGGIMGIAPEGTRSRTGGLIEGKIGCAYMAAHTNVPIVPVALAGTEIGLPALFKFRRPRLQVTIGPAFQLSNSDGRTDRRQLQTYTDKIMRTLAAMLPERLRGVYNDVSTAT